MSRNYIAAWHDYRAEKIIVLERDSEGGVFRKTYNPPYYFYIPDEDGEHLSLYGDKLSRVEFGSKNDYEAAKQRYRTKFESDIPPLNRILMDEYYDKPTPNINYAFLDIEVDYSQKIGYAGPTNPYGIINAVTIYQSWTKQYKTHVVAPKSFTGSLIDLNSKIDQLIEDGSLRVGIKPQIVICKNELELIIAILEDIKNADVISGWNSEVYDIPYICERILLMGGEQMLSRIDYVGVGAPKKDTVNKYGSEEPVYKLRGRAHLDYMDLFKKFTFGGRTSYSLGNILQEEVGVGKLEYSGSLEELYNNDFPTFVAYNFRDVDGLVQLDEKVKFIALANQLAHENTVPFKAVLGTVSYVETGITNHAHNKMKRIVSDKKIIETEKVEGAIVLTPIIGVHDWIGSVDINSLYPNVIRSINISPEKIVGQFYSKGIAWDEINNDSDALLTFRYENGQEESKTAVEWKDTLMLKLWAISAYGTVFDQSSGNGVIADILYYWYSERKRLQAESKKWGKIAAGLTGIEQEAALKKEADYDLLQYTKKISMNSLYGALLNKAFRFNDERMGASVTFTGRQITTHMFKTVGKLLTGKEIAVIKTVSIDSDGETQNDYTTNCDLIIAGDTDSTYFKTCATNKEDAIEIANAVADALNDSFPMLMKKSFLCLDAFSTNIKGGREIVADRGIFLAKKKYICRVVDKEGKATNELKVMGSEIKKADTPKIIQTFLKDVINMILAGEQYDAIATFINTQRKDILKNKNNIFYLGVAKQVNNLEKYIAEYKNPGTVKKENGDKLSITGQARAACNYNYLLSLFEKGAKEIRSGDKILIYSLKQNQFGFKTIGIPSDFPRFPKWFNENFKVDIKTTEEKMFDSKLRGIFDALGKDIPTPQSVLTNSILEF